MHPSEGGIGPIREVISEDSERAKREHKMNEVFRSVGSRFHNPKLNNFSKRFMSLVPENSSVGDKLKNAHEAMLELGSGLYVDLIDGRRRREFD